MGMVKESDLKNIPDGSCYIEWLNRDYNVSKPTMIYIHGEMEGAYDEKVSLLLDEDNYVLYTTTSAPSNVASGILTEAAGGRNLAYYWLRQDYNVGIFHYEIFADDELSNLVKKIFSPVNMRYKLETGYENTNIPSHSLTEILAAKLIAAIPDAATGSEIRLVGNGAGAILALSTTDYLYTYYGKGENIQNKLPRRLAFVDPYLSTSALPDGFLWRNLSVADGALSASKDMLEHCTSNGLVVEMIENVEVGAQSSGGTSIETLTSPYTFEYNDTQLLLKDKLIESAAYLKLRQKYSSMFTELYKAQNRAGVDWYLYSIHGSDDTQIGYPTSAPDYSSSYTNWGPFSTRPMLNDRQRTQTSSSSSRGKNYALSAWTPTTWTRAQKGIRFEMKKYSTNKKDDDGASMSDIHGLAMYVYTDYTLEKFRSENYQKAMNLDATLVCGYVFNDTNEDRLFNDSAVSGIGNAQLNVLLTKTEDSATVTVKQFTTYTERDGFFVLRLDKDDKGEEISYSTTHTLKITVVPKNSKYHFQSKGVVEYHTTDIMKHNFDNGETTLSITYHYSNAITLVNCGLVHKQ